VWPESMAETFLIDAFQCRFTATGGGTVTQSQIIGLMQKVAAAGWDIVKTETLRNFDGQRGYTLAQGQ
jgi:isocitrate dehydrogenase